MGAFANFRVVETTLDVVVIRDLGPWDKHLTITNDAENVVHQLADTLAGRRLLYYDSENELAELKVTNGRFSGFASVANIP